MTDLAAGARQLDQVANDLRDLTELDARAADLVEQAGRQYAPRATGALAGSATVRANVIVSTKTYALPVYAGWRRGRTVVAGRPWLVRGAEAAEDRALAVYQTGVENMLDKLK